MKITLNNNPRVDAEKRIILLVKRKNGLLKYWSRRVCIDFTPESGGQMASQLMIDPSIKSIKAQRLMRETEKEISLLMKQMKKWRK